MTWVKYKGTLVYNPKRKELRKTRKEEQWWLICEIDYGLAAFYRHLVFKRFGLQLQPTAWKPHITVLDGRKQVKPEFQKFWKKYDGQKVEFEYSVDVEQHWKFWVLPVRSKQLMDIRKELGFHNDYPLHVTFGRML